MSVRRSVAVYAAGHFFMDFSCAFLLFRSAAGTGDWYAAVILYNFFAFAGQMPLGLLADRFGNGRVFASLGCLLTAAAYLLPGHVLLLAVAAGAGNALFHIGGGYDTLQQNGTRAGLLGVFVSPGAFGLFLGTFLGKGTFPAVLPAVFLLGSAAAILSLCGRTEGSGPVLRVKGSGLCALAALFLVVCIRSYAGFLFSFLWKTGIWSWIFILCVVFGKTAGGFLYDRAGGLLTSVLSLGLASVLFLLSSPAGGCLAVLLFNMTMPVTLRAAADRLPGAKGFSFGLLTFALFLGFLPAYFSAPGISAGWMYAALCVLSAALLLPAVGKRP